MIFKAHTTDKHKTFSDIREHACINCKRTITLTDNVTYTTLSDGSTIVWHRRDSVDQEDPCREAYIPPPPPVCGTCKGPLEKVRRITNPHHSFICLQCLKANRKLYWLKKVNEKNKPI